MSKATTTTLDRNELARLMIRLLSDAQFAADDAREDRTRIGVLESATRGFRAISKVCGVADATHGHDPLFMSETAGIREIARSAEPHFTAALTAVTVSEARASMELAWRLLSRRIRAEREARRGAAM
jgi:hypothetical protein